jgi:hypothetical protein
MAEHDFNTLMAALSRPRNWQHQPDRRQAPGVSFTWHPEVPVRSRAPMAERDGRHCP